MRRHRFDGLLVGRESQSVDHDSVILLTRPSRLRRSLPSLNSRGRGCLERLLMLPVPVGLRLEDATAASAASATSFPRESDPTGADM